MVPRAAADYARQLKITYKDKNEWEFFISSLFAFHPHLCCSIFVGLDNSIKVNKVRPDEERTTSLNAKGKGAKTRSRTTLVEKEKRRKRKGMGSYALRAKRGLKGLTSDTVDKAGTVIGGVLTGVSKFVGVNYADGVSFEDIGIMVSGGLDIVNSVATLFPFPASTITGALSGILNIFGLGPPPDATNKEVIAAVKKGQQEIKDDIKAGTNKISELLVTGFIEQKNFIHTAFKQQTIYLAKEFDNLEQHITDTFELQFLREIKNDAIALLEQVQEKYDYILPLAQETLTEAQALDLDQHAGILDTTFQTARHSCPKLSSG